MHFHFTQALVLMSLVAPSWEVPMAGGGGGGKPPLGRKDPNKIRIGNTVVDMSNKFVQNFVGPMTTYTLFSEPDSKPLYTRHILDRNRHFVLFPDNKYPSGSGHYIVMRKYKLTGMRGLPQNNMLYEAFDLFLEKSTRALVFNWPKKGAGSGGRAEPYEDPKKDLRVDVGEVVARRKRKLVEEDPPPAFSTIRVSLPSNDASTMSDDSQGMLDYDGLSAPSAFQSEEKLGNLSDNLSDSAGGSSDQQPVIPAENTSVGSGRDILDGNTIGYNVEPEE